MQSRQRIYEVCFQLSGLIDCLPFSGDIVCAVDCRCLLVVKIGSIWWGKRVGNHCQPTHAVYGGNGNRRPNWEKTKYVPQISFCYEDFSRNTPTSTNATVLTDAQQPLEKHDA